MTTAVRYLTAVLLCVSVTTTVEGGAADWPLQGLYRADGVDAAGAPYRALVQITRFGDSYLVSWTFAHPAQTLDEPDRIGVGIACRGMFAVSYFSEDFAGVVLYEIEREDRRLVGQWTGAGGDGVLRAETLTRLDEVRMPESTHPIK